jgi:GntR family transcriptional repressor for pyruvate dehydrogenase complex
MEFKAIVSPTIADLFKSQIQEMIFKGDLKPGDQLPTERELAEDMKISKSVVHNGIKDLEREGFVEIVPRHGVYIADYAKTGNINTLMALLKYHGGMLDLRTTRAMVEIRSAISGLAMELAAERRTPADIQRLKDDLAAFKKAAAAHDAEKALHYSYQFHHDMGVISKNSIIPMLLNSFKDISLNLWKAWLTHFGPKKTVACMETYIDALERHDGEGAKHCFEVQCDRFTKALIDKA